MKILSFFLLLGNFFTKKDNRALINDGLIFILLNKPRCSGLPLLFIFYFHHCQRLILLRLHPPSPFRQCPDPEVKYGKYCRSSIFLVAQACKFVCSQGRVLKTAPKTLLPSSGYIEF